MRSYLSLFLAVFLASHAVGEPVEGIRLGKPQAQKQDAQAALTFSPDGKSVAWVSTREGDEENRITVHVWDVAGRKEVCQCRFSGDSAAATTPLAFSPDG